MTFRLRLAAVAVVAIGGLVGAGVLQAPHDSASAATVTVASVATAKATYTSKQAVAVTAQKTYASKSASTAKARATYLSKLKVSTASQARLKVVKTSKSYSSAYKATATKNVATKVKATATAKSSYYAWKVIAAKYKALAATAAAAAAAAKKAADAAAAALAAATAALPTSAPTDPTADPTGTPTATPTTGTDSTAMPVGSVTSNGRTWTQSYAEDFNTNAALGKVLSTYPQMQAYDGFNDTSGQGLYAPNKVLSVSNSNLDFYLHSENGQPLVAAVMPDGYKPHTTGRISIRYKSDDILGYKFVGMFWPSSDNWNDGEIDWPEADLGSKPRPASAVPGSLKNGAMTFKPAVETFASTDQSQYHVATTEWDRDAIRYYWDGKLVSTVTDAVPTKAMRVTLQAETFIGEGTVPKTTSGHLDIDWISIWD